MPASSSLPGHSPHCALAFASAWASQKLELPEQEALALACMDSDAWCRDDDALHLAKEGAGSLRLSSHLCLGFAVACWLVLATVGAHATTTAAATCTDHKGTESQMEVASSVWIGMRG